MPTMVVNSFSSSVSREIGRLVREAALPKRLPWGPGVTVRNLADTGTHHDRFNDGKFKIEFGGWSLVVDGNVDEQGANVSWEHAVDVESGDVIARPTMLAASCSHAPYAALGFEPRRIGSLGPLVQIFPPAMDELRREYALPNFYGRMDDVHRDLALIAALCKEAAST